jgi:hypothetical protein
MSFYTSIPSDNSISSDRLSGLIRTASAPMPDDVPRSLPPAEAAGAVKVFSFDAAANGGGQAQ